MNRFKRCTAIMLVLFLAWSGVAQASKRATTQAQIQSGQQRTAVSAGRRAIIVYTRKKTVVFRYPSAGSTKVGFFPKGTALMVGKMTGRFIYVRDKAGHKGYVKASSVTKKKPSTKSPSRQKISRLLRTAQRQLGAPYSKRDCSQFTAYCYKRVGIHISSSVKYQGYQSGYRRVKLSRLRAGDLVVFNTVKDSDLSDHVGIYLGRGKFIHSSSAAGKVVISSLSSGYYKQKFSWGLRIIR